MFKRQMYFRPQLHRCVGYCDLIGQYLTSILVGVQQFIDTLTRQLRERTTCSKLFVLSICSVASVKVVFVVVARVGHLHLRRITTKTILFTMKSLLRALIPVSAAAFVAQHPLSSPRSRSHFDDSVLSVAGGSEWDKDDITNMPPSVDLDLPSPPKRKEVVMSPAIPFLECPPLLVDCTMAGNVGFDPLGFAKNKEDLIDMREAEIRHARLAMLVCTYQVLL